MTILSDPIYTPAIVRERGLHDMTTLLDDMTRDLSRPSNEAWFIERSDEITAMARKAAELAQAIHRKAWANRSAA